MESKPRIAKWDNVKFILIMLVVVGHFADAYVEDSSNMKSLFFFIYIFHMPLFVFISGLFSKRAVNAEKLDMTRIFPYLVISVGIKVLFYMTTLGIGDNPEFSLLTTGGVPWFMIALFVWYVLTHWLRHINGIYLFSFSIILACFVGYDNAIGDFLVLSRIIVFYPFFLLGYYLSADKIIEVVDDIKIKIGSVIIMIGTIIVSIIQIDKIYWLRLLFTGRHSYEKLKEFSQYGGMIRLSYYVFVFLFIFSVIALVPKRHFIVSDLGQRTLQVYVLHDVFLFIYHKYNVSHMLAKVFPVHWMYVYILCAVLLTFLLASKHLEKPFLWIARAKKREVI